MDSKFKEVILNDNDLWDYLSKDRQEAMLNIQYQQNGYKRESVFRLYGVKALKKFGGIMWKDVPNCSEWFSYFEEVSMRKNLPSKEIEYKGLKAYYKTSYATDEDIVHLYLTEGSEKKRGVSGRTMYIEVLYSKTK